MCPNPYHCYLIVKKMLSVLEVETTPSWDNADTKRLKLDRCKGNICSVHLEAQQMCSTSTIISMKMNWALLEMCIHDWRASELADGPISANRLAADTDKLLEKTVFASLIGYSFPDRQDDCKAESAGNILLGISIGLMRKPNNLWIEACVLGKML